MRLPLLKINVPYQIIRAQTNGGKFYCSFSPHALCSSLEIIDGFFTLSATEYKSMRNVVSIMTVYVIGNMKLTEYTQSPH